MNNKLNVILTGTPSDSHMWNLIFMELFLQESGCHVLNLGPCVPLGQVYTTLERSSFDLVVVSSVNGHLFQDAMNMIAPNLKNLSSHIPPFVVGGKIGISEKSATFQKKKLVKLGYDDVFIEADSLGRFKKYLDYLGVFKGRSRLKHAI
ncbi:MAG: cobalamin B12-binding domain-containing protein [Candidatus Paracaedibacter sp.]